MNSDLQHLIQLQDVDLAAERARRRITELPSALDALEQRLDAHRNAVADVKARIEAGQAARREIEKQLAEVQGRLSKYKNQLMEVKTNKEYQAMQHEIATAQDHVREHEDRLLDRMEEAESLAGELKAAEAALRAAQAEIASERAALEAGGREAEQELRQLEERRAALAAQTSGPALALFEQVASHRKGVGLSEARDGLCSQCHVRLRPQVFNEVRRNDALLQCESCSRILYFVAVPAPADSTAPTA